MGDFMLKMTKNYHSLFKEIRLVEKKLREKKTIYV